MSKDIEFHSQEWWINRVDFWQAKIDDSTLIEKEISEIPQKEWSEEQRNAIRNARETLRHAGCNIEIAKSKIMH